MDRDAGRLYVVPGNEEPMIPAGWKEWRYGERVEVKGCWFEVTKIDLRKQRVVLKPIPRPANPEAARHE